MADIYSDGILTIAFGIIATDKAASEPLLKTSDVVVTALSSAYFILVSKGVIAPIEALPVEQKKDLWQESAFRGSKERREAYCRAKTVFQHL